MSGDEQRDELRESLAEASGISMGLGVPPADPVDPVIRAMFDRLPPAGAVFPTPERDRWLHALSAIFAMVYREPIIVRPDDMDDADWKKLKEPSSMPDFLRRADRE